MNCATSNRQAVSTMVSTQLLQKAGWDAITADLTIDGKPHVLNLSAFHAARKATMWRAERGVVYFAFPEGDAGYIAEIGHVIDFEQQRAETVRASIRFRKHDFKNATIALHVFLYDAKNSVLAKHRLSCDGGTAQGQYTIPARAVKMCFSLRLSGEGHFTMPTLTVTRGAAKKIARVQTAQEQAATAFIRERQYQAAIDSLGGNTDSDRILLLKCYTALHLFEKAVETFQALSPRGQLNTAARAHYLRALANLGETEKAQCLIESSAMNLQSKTGDVDFLLCAYPFATFLSTRLAQMVRGRILASARHLKKGHLNQVLRCAHDLVNEQRFEEFYRLCDVLSAMDLSREEQARMHVLSAQTFYVLDRHKQKLAALNKAFETFKLKPLALRKGHRPLTHRNITCPDAAARSIRGPLVSVIMTTHNSASTVLYALTSVMLQTYADLEILVVDDASTDKTRAIVERLAKRDKRITLIQQDRNGGTYVAKNCALKLARGIYITCHDSDDWAHPQKIERSVAALVDDPKLIATASQHVRYDPKRGFRGRNGYIQIDAPSLMYRRREVLRQIGYYDSVRAGADTEHQWRIEKAFGRDCVRYLPDLLTLFLWSETSLTGGGMFAIDDDTGIFSKTRSAYRRAHIPWLEKAQSVRIEFPLTERPFDIPQEMKP